jgi:hypothetical protein
VRKNSARERNTRVTLQREVTPNTIQITTAGAAVSTFHLLKPLGRAGISLVIFLLGQRIRMD